MSTPAAPSPTAAGTVIADEDLTPEQRGTPRDGEVRARPASTGHRPAPPGRGEAHVWRVPLRGDAEHVGRLRDVLSPAELVAERRLRYEGDRARLVIRRAAVREILGGYLDRPPGDLRFHVGTHGKPEIAGRAHTDLRFSSSHSGELAVVAVTVGCRVGVDVEAVRPVDDAMAIASAYFSPAERHALAAVAAADRSTAFLRCWTRKEAFVKALGEGLSHPLADFDVSLTPGEPAALLRVGQDRTAHRRWSVTSFAPSEGHVAALVADVPTCRVSDWPWLGSAA